VISATTSTRGWGWRPDFDFRDADGTRSVRATPPGSASVFFSTGIASGRDLVVDDIDAAQAELTRDGAEVSEVFHLDGAKPVPGPAFNDPDGNHYLVQEVTIRLPGRTIPADARLRAVARDRRAGAGISGGRPRSDLRDPAPIWWRDGSGAGMADNALIEQLDEAECLRLAGTAEVGRLGYSGRYGPTVLPVNYRLFEGTIVFRTSQDRSVDEDLRTGIDGAEFKVAFEIDSIDPDRREGWSVLIQGSAHHVDSEAERAAVDKAGVEPLPGGARELFLRIVPTTIIGRRIRRP
jgi:Pyridoxamine 5'-phosphate oxidase